MTSSVPTTVATSAWQKTTENETVTKILTKLEKSFRKLRLRRNYIVDRGFQFNVLFRAVAFVVFMLLIMSICLFQPLVNEFMHDRGEQADTWELAVALLYMHDHFWPVALFCLVFTIIAVILTTHRVAGPLVRVKRHMRSVADGGFPRPLRTRHNDYLKTEVEVLNDMVASLARRIDRIKATNAELCGSLAQASKIAATQQDSEIREVLDRALAQARRLNSQLAEFRREEEVDSVGSGAGSTTCPGSGKPVDPGHGEPSAHRSHSPSPVGP
jgi:methyl-accepting chemotaxis protein